MPIATVTFSNFRLLDWRLAYLNWLARGTEPYDSPAGDVVSIEEVL